MARDCSSNWPPAGSIAILGAAGQLGGWLCQQLGPVAWPLDLPDLDIANRAAVLRLLTDVKPAAIVNCAAYTAVDRAEREPEQCFAVNATAVEYLAEAATELDCPLVQISTDYVFGVAPMELRPWREDDTPQPIGVYAASKHVGERAAARAPKHLVVRTCGLYGHATLVDGARNFVEAILQNAERGEALRVVHDQVCSPSYARDVANAIRFLVAGDHSGTFHVTNAGATTWYDFARCIIELRGLSVPIEPISTAEYNAPAHRPQYSVLDTSKYASLGGPPMAGIRDAVADYLSWRSLAIAQRTPPTDGSTTAD